MIQQDPAGSPTGSCRKEPAGSYKILHNSTGSCDMIWQDPAVQDPLQDPSGKILPDPA